MRPPPARRLLDDDDGLGSARGPHTLTITTPAGTAYESTAPPVLGWGSQDPAGEEHRPPRALTVTENRMLDRMQSRLDHGEDFTDADWEHYGHLTWLLTG